MNPLEQQNLIVNQPSAERRRELDDAKNALKKIIDSIPLEQLMAINDPVTSLLLKGCDGDVDKYIHLKMKGNAGNAPDIAAFHVTENLLQIKERLEDKN